MAENECKCCGDIVVPGGRSCPDCPNPRRRPRFERCPFCGDKALMTECRHSTLPFQVECIGDDDECGAKGPMRATYEEALAVWNTRHKAENKSAKDQCLRCNCWYTPGEECPGCGGDGSWYEPKGDGTSPEE